MVAEHIQAMRDMIVYYERLMADYRLEIARLNRLIDRSTHGCIHDFSFDSDVCRLCGFVK